MPITGMLKELTIRITYSYLKIQYLKLDLISDNESQELLVQMQNHLPRNAVIGYTGDW